MISHFGYLIARRLKPALGCWKQQDYAEASESKSDELTHANSSTI